jgi:hypothetical protein
VKHNAAAKNTILHAHKKVTSSWEAAGLNSVRFQTFIKTRARQFKIINNKLITTWRGLAQHAESIELISEH